MTLYYIVITEEACSNIETLIQSKYLGELKYKLTGFLKYELFLNPSKNNPSNFDLSIATYVIISFKRFRHLLNAKEKVNLSNIYLYKDLKEYELSALHLSMNILKIHAYKEEDSKIIQLINDYCQSYYEVINFLKQIEKIKGNLGENAERINFYLNKISIELLDQKESIPDQFKSIEFSEQIERAIKNPILLIRSKKLIKVYSDWHDKITNLRFS